MLISRVVSNFSFGKRSVVYSAKSHERSCELYREMPTDRLARLYTTTSTVLNTHPHTWHGTRIQLPPASFLVLCDFSAGFARGLSESFTIFRASAVVLAQQATPKAAKVATRMTRTAAAAPTARGMDSPAHDARMHRWTRRSKSKTTRVPTLTWTSWTQAGRPGLLTQSPSTTILCFPKPQRS
jgi:hypothetical protein